MKGLRGQLKGTEGQGLVNFELLKLDEAGNAVRLKDVGFNPNKGLAYGDELGELDFAKISQEQADQIIALGKKKIDLELLRQVLPSKLKNIVNPLSSGGRVGFKDGKGGAHTFLKEAGFNIDKCSGSKECIRGVIEAEQKAAQKGGKEALKKFSKFGKAARFAGWFLGPADLAVELAFALPHMLQGDREAAKRATTYGLLGWGEKKLDEIKADSPEAYKYAKHVKDNKEWMDAWFNKQDAEQNLKTLEGLPESAQKERRIIYEDLLNKSDATMAKIQEEYVGYVDEEGEFDALLGAKGKTALQDYLREDVKKKADAGFQIDIDLPFYQKKNVAGIAPFKGGQPITNLEQYIKQKNEPYWKSGLEHAAYESGVADLFDNYLVGGGTEKGGYMRKYEDPDSGEIKYDIDMGSKAAQDLYSELPLEYASQLGKMEAEETRRLLDEREIKKETEEALEEYGPLHTRFAGGGIADIRRPNAIPPESGPTPYGLPSMLNRVKKW